ncbi:acyltransferase family protein [Pseudomonas mangiferae]|uniref:acyltransferase family protein n=1 Tax=Pseudomonas mangiferae TaxID=2593654 RepID=UPI0015B77E45|nr:acyltransferase [Pseudomonas mangiferae]
MKYLWLQVARGVAALGVLFFHVSTCWQEIAWMAPVVAAAHWGFFGVDIFFVLSGFVIAASITRKQGQADALQFLALRFARIYLGYWPALLLFVAVAWYVNGVSLPLEKAWQSVFLLSGKIENHWLAIAWSLFFELYFYALAALLIARVSPEKRALAISVAMAVIAAWNAGWLVLNAETVQAGLQPRRDVLSGLVLEFLMGCLLYELRHLCSFSALKILNLSSLVVVTFAVGTFSHWFDKIEVLRVGSFGLSAAALIAVALCLEDSPYRPWRWLVLTGDSSYALYLTHIVVISLAVTASTSLFIGTRLYTLNLLLIPLYAWLFAAAWYRWLEHPLYEAAKGRLSALFAPHGSDGLVSRDTRGS